MTPNPAFSDHAQPLRRHAFAPAAGAPIVIRRRLYLSGLGALLGHAVPQAGATTTDRSLAQTPFAAGRRKAAA